MVMHKKALLHDLLLAKNKYYKVEKYYNCMLCTISSYPCIILAKIKVEKNLDQPQSF